MKRLLLAQSHKLFSDTVGLDFQAYAIKHLARLWRELPRPPHTEGRAVASYLPSPQSRRVNRPVHAQAGGARRGPEQAEGAQAVRAQAEGYQGSLLAVEYVRAPYPSSCHSQARTKVEKVTWTDLRRQKGIA